MNIVKYNESFTITDSTDKFEIKGDIARSMSGSLNIRFNVNTITGEYFGDCHYNKYAENNTVNFSINCPEENRDEFTEYVNTIINSVLNYFETLN
jgi:hypothetical protein